MYCSYIFCGEALEGHQDIVESVDSIHHRSVKLMSQLSSLKRSTASMFPFMRYQALLGLEHLAARSTPAFSLDMNNHRYHIGQSRCAHKKHGL